ncbi:hypothetical protein HDE_04528 [Halotydeus destructor]|nr:hypothetical protein HDE_04528 [Halotydeus destructor]
MKRILVLIFILALAHCQTRQSEAELIHRAQDGVREAKELVNRAEEQVSGILGRLTSQLAGLVNKGSLPKDVAEAQLDRVMAKFPKELAPERWLPSARQASEDSRLFVNALDAIVQLARKSTTTFS